MMTQLNLALVLLLLVTPAAIAAEPQPPVPTWSETFKGDELYKAMTGQRVLIATSTKEAQVAGAALNARLRVWRLPLIMDSSPLGDLAGLSDKEIVGRSSNLPIDRVVIVRVFGGVDVVVTIYDKSGVPKSSFAGKRGSLIVMDATGPPSVSKEVVPPEAPTAKQLALEEPVDDLPKRKSARLKSFEKNAIYWSEGIRVSINAWRASAVKFGIARRGRHGARLRGASFYSAVGRRDLAAEYRLRSGLKYGLGYGGGVAFVVVGTGMAVVTLLNGTDGIAENPVFIGGLVLVGVGSLGIAIASAVRTHPLQMNERRRLADEHNEDLLEALRLGPADVTWTATPTIGADGGGLAMSGQF